MQTSEECAAMSPNDAVDGARSAASKCYRLVASRPERFKEVRNDDGISKFWRNWRGHHDVMQTRSTRSAQSIMASGHTGCTNRPHT
jgi:deoxyxylulose-5-phosphate synthase